MKPETKKKADKHKFTPPQFTLIYQSYLVRSLHMTLPLSLLHLDTRFSIPSMAHYPSMTRYFINNFPVCFFFCIANSIVSEI